MTTTELNRADFLKGLGDYFFWNLSFKYRKFLVPSLTVLVIVGAILIANNHISLEHKIKQLSAYEPIYVLSVSRNLNIGDIIREDDLQATLYYRNEYEKISTMDEQSGLQQPSLIQCQYHSETGALSGFDDVISRIVTVPLLKGTLLRKEFFAGLDATPGLINLIDKNHSLIDIEVPQTGFNVYIKPNDFVDLYEINKGSSSLIANKIKIILVDSAPLGKAPFQVAVNPQAKRNLTLAVPDTIFARVLQSKKNNNLTVTYDNKYADKIEHQKNNLASGSKTNSFQDLTFIKGKKKEVLGLRNLSNE